MTAIHRPTFLAEEPLRPRTEDEILAAYIEVRERPFWGDASAVEIAEELGVDVLDVLRAEARLLNRRRADRVMELYRDVIQRRGLDLTWDELAITLLEAFDSRFARAEKHNEGGAA